ncbi:unnamed protein product [Hymenolepis diminuta]|uniref:F-box protein n=1 Tax=Hymenolepis diminuta TaxID=6216 RepID=A0A0R3SMI4_HYMDI|nr:unnamed protein product [Hymenolepis diminuta]
MIKGRCTLVGLATENKISSLALRLIGFRMKFTSTISPLHSTVLLTRRSGEIGGGGGEKWQWLPYTPMNEEHDGHPLAVYFQWRVYVVGYGEIVQKMEMLDVAAGGQWTSLTFSPQRQNLNIQQ